VKKTMSFTSLLVACRQISRSLICQRHTETRFWILQDHQLICELYIDRNKNTLFYPAVDACTNQICHLLFELCQRFTIKDVKEHICVKTNGVILYGDDAILYHTKLEHSVIKEYH